MVTKACADTTRRQDGEQVAMHEIICPHCKKAFKVDKAGYADIMKQVRDHEFKQQLPDKKFRTERIVPRCRLHGLFFQYLSQNPRPVPHKHITYFPVMLPFSSPYSDSSDFFFYSHQQCTKTGTIPQQRNPALLFRFRAIMHLHR